MSTRLPGCTLAVALSIVWVSGCGTSSKEPDKKTGAATSGQAKTGAAAPAPAQSALTAKRLPNLPLQADVAESWKVEEDKVAPEGGARLSTPTGEVSIMKDGVGGVKKMTLDDEKKLMTSGSAPPQDVKEEQLVDGWVLSFKAGSILPYHATVYRTIDASSYRCVITTEEAAQMADGIAVCKSLSKSLGP